MISVFLASALMLAVAPTAEESGAASEWVSRAFSGAEGAARLPFSFVFGDKPSAELLSAWQYEEVEHAQQTGVRRSSLTWRDPVSGLECRCELTLFDDFPAVEWVLYFKNTGDSDTPILRDIKALDCGLQVPRANGAIVRHANGSECRLDDFAPKSTSLGPNEHDPQGAWIGEGNPFRIESKTGRSSCGALPFFNLDMMDHGVIGAVGWTGDWAASFHRTDSEVHMKAGMRRTHMKLLPGEEIRSPRIMLLFWQGDALRGHNLLRRFILAHHTPKVNGERARAPICNATWGGNFADKHIAHGRWWKEQGLPMEFLWVDANWFGNDQPKEGATVFNSDWGRYVGDWYPNPGYFPNGLKPVGDALKDAGIGFLLWLEPERVFQDTSWSREHPEWLLGPIGKNQLLNLGNPDARRMLTEHLSSLITEGSIGCYRQDFNMDPQPFWEAADAPDRVGMSEIGHITGLYAVWDELLARHPGLLIDNCSSGGRRIDLETISRSMPLWRSDVQCWPDFGATAMQGQTQGLGLWVPLSTGACDREDTYVFRSALGPGMVMIMYEFEKDVANHFSLDWLRKNLDQLSQVRDMFLGDFYPLLSFSLSDDAWAAWQFDRPESGDGLVLALRRPASPFSVMTPKLSGIDPDAMYEVKDMDTGAVDQRSGKELTESGLGIEINQQPGSRLFVYKRLSPKG